MTTKKVNSEPISKDKEEEMSSALIAQLLAEDAMMHGNDSYYAEYSNDARGYDRYLAREEQDDSYEDNSEDEFNPKKKQTKNNKSKRGRKRKVPTKEKVVVVSEPAPPSENTAVEQQNEKVINQETKINNKKPKKVIPEGYNTGAYTDLEEQRFIEGLELFGRDWTKLQSHVGTRDGTSIRSHAQKHFIKMYRDQIPLPPKVLETGSGYTLSGKPLDPNSSAAKPYLSRNSQSTLNNVKKAPTKTSVEEPAKANTKEDPMEDVKENNMTDVIINKVEKQTEDLRITDEKKEVQKKKKTKSVTPSPSSSTNTSYDSQGRTSYSISRLRRQRDTGSINYGIFNKNDDPLTMIKCEPFIGKPGSNISGSQPFEITVESNVLLAMDFHAHLMTTEIIGFLAGDWDIETKRMIIREAFPCRSIETGQNDVNVEMDPTSAIETRQKIEERKMKVVGWYHSHPTFIPDPSLVDIENQRNYQMLCRDDHAKDNEKEIMEPFVGAIVGPYDPALPGSASVINWFHVINESSNPVPKRLIYELKENESMTEDETSRLFELLEIYKNSPEKVVFAEYWRQDASESKLQKMIKSLGSRMPWVQKQLKENTSVNDSFLEKVQTNLKDW
ncbi:uncharacterized protein BX663DRAFT_507009 [Cokeromyces recurvatus]|uniref:uncharacterized protein n=1 Tax=Cokeromyces recurvatus TaxID=90255 RepID=UPI00221E6AA9|nr:uncharacterized protein BX663DRAFT_507009 [Cokeromyces recurvatus]KAI7903590.1 hypothetical protein BX663DRAFT_507009 [Cokeromyces recurvatus]